MRPQLSSVRTHAAVRGALTGLVAALAIVGVLAGWIGTALPFESNPFAAESVRTRADGTVVAGTPHVAARLERYASMR
jgi:hypothetical protein